MKKDLKSEADFILVAAGGVAAIIMAFEAGAASDWIRRIGHGVVIGLVVIHLAMRHVYKHNDDV